MRWIRKQTEPRSLLQWRLANRNCPNFDYDNLPCKPEILRSLLEEQGWLCAYTGLQIDENHSHIEHLKAQAHCQAGEDVDYTNIVACYPAPNTGEAPFGAHQKRDWPAPGNQHLFVSPLDPGCEAKFNFNYRGEVLPRNENEAARQTIKKLKLNHSELEAKRRSAIKGTLQPRGQYLNREQTRRLLASYSNQSGRLPPFIFALKCALQNHLRNLESPRRS